MSSPGTFRTSRQFTESPAAIYGAFADGATLASWWGPNGFRSEFESFDFRPGGTWKFVMVGPDARRYPNESAFSRVETARLVVIRHVSPPTFTLTIELTAVQGGTRLDWTQAFDDPTLATAIRHIVEPANEQNLDRLAAALRRTRSAARRRSRSVDGAPTAAKPKGAAVRTGRPAAAKSKRRVGDTKPTLLAGGNPQIAKGDGDAPVHAYIAAMPGWTRLVGRRLDALIVRIVPNVRKAVRWNSPFYGVEGQGWFMAFHVFTRYVKVTFFRGTSLRPVPTGGTAKDARWIDIHADDLDEALMATWIRQAAAMPGWGQSQVVERKRP